jgi:putative copper export protein
VIPVTWATIRVFVHALAAAVWVGGQLTLAGLVPTLRSVSPDAPRLAARRFAVIAWSAYAVLIVTGIWNILALTPTFTGEYGVTLMVKILVVALSGISAAAHSVSRSTRGRAIWGALAAVTAVVAFFLGVLLHG